MQDPSRHDLERLERERRLPALILSVFVALFATFGSAVHVWLDKDVWCQDHQAFECRDDGDPKAPASSGAPHDQHHHLCPVLNNAQPNAPSLAAGPVLVAHALAWIPTPQVPAPIQVARDLLRLAPKTSPPSAA